MVKSVTRSHHYPPDVIDELFLDDNDYHGLEWLYNDVIEEVKGYKKDK